MTRYFIFGFILVGLVSSNQRLYGESEAPSPSPPDHIMVMDSDLTWAEGPASLPKGAKFAVLEGNPSQSGEFTMRIEVPANYKIAPHWHPAIEHVTVISGSFYMGLGETFDAAKASKMDVGGFAAMAVGTRHFAFTKDEGAIVQLHGMGPWGITYVNPTDDPRKETPTP